MGARIKKERPYILPVANSWLRHCLAAWQSPLSVRIAGNWLARFTKQSGEKALSAEAGAGRCLCQRNATPVRLSAKLHSGFVKRMS